MCLIVAPVSALQDTLTVGSETGPNPVPSERSHSLTPTVSLIPVCAWCHPGKTGQNVTHGICRRHFRYQLFIIRGRQPRRFQRTVPNLLEVAA
jgi:hypothetical protein